jgi:methionine synthase II (cobalamin-independent)
MLPLLPTTIAGSLPKPSWLAEPEKLWAPWKLEGDALDEGKRDAVRLVLAMQEKAGIDIVSDGEQTRRHFVNGYMEKLEGIDFKNLKTVRIRNRYDANVPRVVGTGVAPEPGAFRRREVPALGDRERDQVHAARADDDGGHALRRALRLAREARHGVRRDPEPGSA